MPVEGNPIPPIQRDYAVAPIDSDGVRKAGAARIDITPRLGIALGGYGFMSGGHGRKLWGRLFATVLVLDDGQGERVALVTTDLFIGSRYVIERIARLVAPTTGLSVDRILLAASHNHSGPGHLHGEAFYDAMAAEGKPGLDLVTADYVADRIATAMLAACTSLVPARVGYANTPCWGYAINRSMPAFLANIDVPAGRRNTPASKKKIRAAATEINETAPPAELPFRRQTIDSRMHVIWAGEAAPSTSTIGVFALFGTHPNLTTCKMQMLTSDSFGTACRVAMRRYHAEHRERPPVGLAAGPQGDGNLVVPGLGLEAILDLRKRKSRALELSVEAGVGLGKALFEAAESARRAARDDFTLDVLYDEVVTRSAPVVGPPAGKLASWAEPGFPTLGASEFNEGFTSLLFKEGKTEKDLVPGNAEQQPKKVLPGCLKALQRLFGAGEPTSMLPLKAIRVGDTWLATAPGEPTTWVGLSIRRAIRGASGDHDAPVLVAGISGEYCGYWTMPPEYDAQHYEGSSTQWGRLAGTWLAEQYARIVTHGVRDTSSPQALFDGVVRRPYVSFEPAHPSGTISSAPTVRHFRVRVKTAESRQGRRRKVIRFSGSWQAPNHGALPPLGYGPWLALEWRSASGFVPLVYRGVEVDDQSFPFLIHRVGMPNYVSWRWELEMRWVSAWAGRDVRFRITAPAAVKGVGPAVSPVRRIR